MGILSKIIVGISLVGMLSGYMKNIFGFEIDQIAWIGIGNIGLLIGYLLHLYDERKKWRLAFLTTNPQYREFELLWKLNRLLSHARFYLRPGNLPGEGKLEEWHGEVIKTLEEWNRDYKDYYLLNDKPNLGHRVCQLEQTLDWILC